MSDDPVRSAPTQLNQGAPGARKVLCLGYRQGETAVIDALIAHGCALWHSAERTADLSGYDVVVSFGYRHILPAAVIAGAGAPIVNLHISYLPYNRGAHPNFWSFYDGTPSGVSIHLIDAGIDTGPVLFQRYVNFDRGEATFAQTQRRLIEEIEALFIAHLDAIVGGAYLPKKQRRPGTFHRVAELPKQFAGWDANVDAEIARLDEIARRDALAGGAPAPGGA